jgi:hypothetical protein
MIAAPLLVQLALGQMGFGPLSPGSDSLYPNAGWVLDHGAWPLLSTLCGSHMHNGTRFGAVRLVLVTALGAKPRFREGTLKVQADARVYLVQDYTHSRGVQSDWDNTHWPKHKYVRFDLRREPLEFTLDLSHVPCGCLACVCTRTAVSALALLSHRSTCTLRVDHL